MARLHKGWNSGAAALEMALVTPVFLTFVLGAFNLGWALYCGSEVRHAVERSTRLLIADPDTSESTIQTFVDGELHAADPTAVSVSLNTETVGASGSIARLGWTYAYSIQMPFVHPVTLNFDSSMVVPLRT